MIVNVTIPFGHTLSPLKLTRGIRMDEVLLGPLSTARREVNDVCRAIVIYQNPFSIESFNHEHNDQRVIMKLFHPSDIFF